MFLILALPAAGQATVEAGLGTAASSMGAAGSQGVGKGVKGILGNLDKALDPSGASKSTAPAASRATPKSRRMARESVPPPETAAAPAPVYEDASQIEKGMAQADVARRFGPPAMQIANGSDAQTLTYMSPRGAVQVELQGGQVVSVTKPKSGA